MYLKAAEGSRHNAQSIHPPRRNLLKKHRYIISIGLMVHFCHAVTGGWAVREKRRKAMTKERAEAIEAAALMLETMRDKFAEWFDAEHKEWSEDKENPDRESDLSLDLRTDHFRLAGECIEKAIEHLQGTM